MAGYDTRRQELLSAIDLLNEAVTIFTPTNQQARQQLDLAQKLVNQSAVTLAVVGAEGHGKSSLIDAIVGADVVPREAQHPGTVAPVLIQWHPGDGIQYFVGLDDTSTLTLCTESEQFRRFILQRFNPNNERGVRFGLVQYHHQLLADGLHLLDMPGLEGVSETVNDAVQEELTDTSAVIVVIRDRQYGAACRLIEKFQTQLNIQAVVCNWSLDFWLGKSDEALHCQIEKQKQIVIEELSSAEVKINPAHVFVLHVPSISHCELLPEALTASVPHRQEIERFRNWITRYLDQDRVTTLLEETRKHICEVIDQVEQRIQNHKQLLDALHQGGKHSRQEARKMLQAAHTHALKQWRKLANSPEIADMVENNWMMLRHKLALCRDSVLHTFNQVQSTLPPSSQWDSSVVATLVNCLRPAFVTAEEQILQTQAELTLSLAKRLREISDRLLTEVFETVPILEGALDPLQIGGDPWVDFTHPDPGPATFFEIWSTRRTVERILASYRTQAEAIETTRTGVQYKMYAATTAAAKQMFFDALEERFQQKYALLENDTEILQQLPDYYNLLYTGTEKLCQLKAFAYVIVGDSFTSCS